MIASDSCHKLVQNFEGLRLTAYRDAAGIWTIGYGHTGPDVRSGLVITADQAQTLLCKDMAWAEAAVNDNVNVPLTQNQFDALVSFVYNVGGNAFIHSNLLVKLNSKDYAGAANEIELWNKGGTPLKVLMGLVRRRHVERMLFEEVETE